MEKEESDQIQKSVLRLRRGFIFSLGTLITLLILWILNVIYFSYVYYLQLLFSPPILFTLPLLLAFLYMGGIYSRASAWEQMNERNVSTVLSIGGSIVFLSPLFLLCLWMESPNYLAIPLAIWLIYTVFELHALNVLEKNCELNLKGKNINNHRNDSRNRFIHPSSHHALYAGITNPIHSNLYLFIPQSSDSISHNFMHFNHQGINKTNQNNLLSFSLIFSRISLNHSFIRNQDKQRALQNARPRNGRNNRLLSKRRTCRIC